MDVNDLTKQVSTILNQVMTDAYGAKAISNIDTTNLSQVFDYMSASPINKRVFFETLYGMFGAEIYAIRAYNRETLPIWRDSRAYGALVLKTYVAPIDAIDHPAYNVKDGDTGNTFTMQFADMKSAIIEMSEAWALPLSTLDVQLKDAFSSEAKMSAFLETQYVTLENSMEDIMEKNENMLLAKFMALKINTTSEGIHAVNLLTEFNKTVTTPITASTALSNPDFLRFANQIMAIHMRLMTKRTKMFNVNEFVRHTPKENAVVLMLNNYVQANVMNLQSDTYHKELVSLPNFQDVPYWQSPGVAGEFASVSTISVTDTTNNINLTQTGIVAVIYDDYAIAATLRDRENPTQYDKFKRVTHTEAQATVQCYCDISENGVVYYIEDTP